MKSWVISFRKREWSFDLRGVKINYNLCSEINICHSLLLGKKKKIHLSSQLFCSYCHLKMKELWLGQKLLLIFGYLDELNCVIVFIWTQRQVSPQDQESQVQAFLPEVLSQGCSHCVSHLVFAQSTVRIAWSVQYSNTESWLAAISPYEPQNSAAASEAAACCHRAGRETALKVWAAQQAVPRSTFASLSFTKNNKVDGHLMAVCHCLLLSTNLSLSTNNIRCFR